VEYPVPEPIETAPATQLVTSLAAEPHAPPAAETRIAEEAGAEAVVAADPEPAPEAAAVDEAASVAEAVPVEAEPGAIEAVVVAETSLLVLEHAVIAPEAEVMASEAIAPPSDGAPMIAAAAEAPPPAESTVVDFGATEAASPVFAPPQPVMASAGTPAYPVSVLATATPMETTHQSGSAAAGPPPHSTPPHPSVPPVGAENGTSQPDAPVTRTVRIEVPARASSSRASGIDRLLRTADGAGASELFLVSQGRPYVRVAGNVRPLENEAPLLATDIEALIADVTPEPSRDAIRRGDPAEWLLEVSDVGRVRCSTFRDHRGPGANFHFAFLRTATADDLQLGAELRRLATEPDGLILVGGLAGSDVSAIVAAFVDILNQQRADYIVTLEPQVRVAHVNRQALVSQREVGNDPVRVVAAARAALREEPDVLVIEGVASGELAQLAIDAATQDRLVIASVDAPSASAAVRRLMDLVPEDQRAAVRVQLSRCFRGAVAQLLVRRMTGGRVSLRELMPSTRAVSRLLAEGEMSNLMSHMESGAAGHKSLTESLVEHVRAGVVDVREAVRKAPDADRLFARLKSAAVDLGALEGWN
jgi:twitching motility protein PilT